MSILPSDIATLHGWWKADAIVGLTHLDLVTSWEDQSGNGFDATPTVSFEPRYDTNVVNGKPAIYFNQKTLDVDRASVVSGLTAATMLVVMKYDTESGGNGGPFYLQSQDVGAAPNEWTWFDDGGGLYDAWGSTARKSTGNPSAPMTQWNITTQLSASNDWRVYFNGTLHYSTATNTFGMATGGRIGFTTFSNYVKGYLAEILLFSDPLSTLNQQEMEWYLAEKYNISGPTDPTPASSKFVFTNFIL